MEPQTGIKTWQWVVTVIVIIVLIIIGIMVFGGKKTPEPALTAPTDTTTPDTSAQANRIIMSDQYPGNVVYLSSVQLANPGWVVIQADKAGQPGAIIGSSYMNAGIAPGKVTVSTPIVDGGTYYAVLYSDNGDKIFNAATDLPLRDANGSIILKVFHGSSTVGAEIKG